MNTKAKFKIGQVVRIPTKFLLSEHREFQKIATKSFDKKYGWMYCSEAFLFACESWIKPLTPKEAGQ